MLFNKKVIFIVILIGSILLLHTMIYADNGIKVIIDDKELITDVSPVIIDNRTLVPLRSIFEALGAEVNWDASSDTVTANKGKSTIILKINDKYPTVNGKQQELDVPATIINDRTMVPVRFIANSLSTYVEWDDKTETVIIITPVTISFKDKNLENIIRREIGVSEGDIKNTDVRKINSLDASNAKITSIEGIENLCSLTSLNLSKNKIMNITPLQSLKKLVELDLNNNRISNLYYLKELTLLRSLDLSSNAIKNISSLDKMDNLKVLKLQYNPLDGLSGLTKLSETTQIYLLDNKNPIAARNAESIKEYEKVIKEASEIIASLITTGMTDLEKELALHDYLTINTKYDFESLVNLIPSDYCHSAYGALINKKAVCDGYAKAFEIMLNMVGVECDTITGISFSYDGRPIGHAWNIVKIDDKYYHVDVSGNDMDGNLAQMNHLYFNLSDKQIGLTHNWNTQLYPKCSDDNKDYDSWKQLTKRTFYSADEENIIFTVAGNNLYKVDSNTSKATKLTDDKVYEIQYFNGDIYYINNSDQNQIYKVKADGTGRTKINDGSCEDIAINDKFIYFILSDNKNLYRINLGNITQVQEKIEMGDFTTSIFVVNNWLYCRTFSWNSGGSIVRINNEKTKEYIVNRNTAGFKEKSDGRERVLSSSFGVFERISSDYLYYINSLDNTLYRVKLNGREDEQICKDSIDNLYFEVVGEYIYYQNSKDENKTYRVNTDGNQRMCLE